jgi:LPXTG-motif cell wall-anchored protein
VRHLVLLASVYTLVAVLALPSSLVASDEPAPPVAAETGETATAPAGPVPPAPSPVPDAQQAPVPPPEPQTSTAPPPAAEQPVPAPIPQQAAAAPAEPRAEQDLGDEREQGRPKADRVVATAAASTSVTIRDFAFSPKSITIDVGDTVTWTNQDDVEHSATAEDGSFDTGTFGNGQSRSHTFDAAGTFQYICTPHPFMKGTINVNAAGGGGSGSGDSGSGSGGSSGSGSGSGSSSSSGSGSSSSSGASDSGSSSSSSGSSTSSGSVLPDTGADPASLAILGLLMLALGVAVQRRARTNQS